MGVNAKIVALIQRDITEMATVREWEQDGDYPTTQFWNGYDQAYARIQRLIDDGEDAE